MKKIKIVGLNCSPRTNSNSRKILEYAFDANNKNVDYEIIDLKDKNIKPCLACSVCGKDKKTGEFLPCTIQDDEVSEILEKMVKADGIAVATPVYFGLPSDLFSKFIMRTRLIRHMDFALVNKVVGVMAIAGRRSGGAETTITSTWLPFIRQGCIIVGNGDKTSQFGTMGWAGPKGEILSDEWGLEQAVDTVDRIMTVAKLLKAGAQTTGYENHLEFSYKSGTRPK